MTEKRTAEEILAEHLKKDSVAIHAYGQWTVTSAMHEFAAQELDAYKAKLKNHLAYEHESIHISWQEMIELIDKI